MERIPPQNIEAERSLLGAIILGCGDPLADLGDTISGSSFYSADNGSVFNAVAALVAAGLPVEVLSVRDQLAAQGASENARDLDYLNGLVTSVASSQSAEYYARAVRDAALKRRLIDDCNEAILTAYNDGGDADGLIESLQAKAFALGAAGRDDFIHDAETVTHKALDLADKGGGGRGLQTWFPALDEKIGGFRPGAFIVIAARPSMGKTTLLWNILLKIAIHKKKVALLSLEMLAEDVGLNMMCCIQRVRTGRVRHGECDSEDYAKLAKASGQLAALPLVVCDPPSLTTTSFAAIARRLVAQGVELIAVDYLQLMQSSSKAESQVQKLDDISKTLKRVARELNVPVVAAAQLNRGVEGRESRRPVLSDMKGCGGIEEDADMALLIHRPEYYDPTDRVGMADVLVAKNRNGPTGDVVLAFRKEYMRFEEPTGEEMEEWTSRTGK
jgi:replicative DNA helicase